jgi:hypothetical protein
MRHAPRTNVLACTMGTCTMNIRFAFARMAMAARGASESVWH